MSKRNTEAPQIRLLRDGELRVVDTPAQAVALEFDGWQREADPEPESAPKVARTSSSSSS